MIIFKNNCYHFEIARDSGGNTLMTHFTMLIDVEMMKPPDMPTFETIEETAVEETGILDPIVLESGNLSDVESCSGYSTGINYCGC